MVLARNLLQAKKRINLDVFVVRRDTEEHWCCSANLLAETQRCLTNRHESKAPPRKPLHRRKRRRVGAPPPGTSAHGSRSRCVLGRQYPNGVSLGRAKADSPSPRDGPQHPILEMGFGALPCAVQTGRGKLAGPVKHDGSLYKREGSKIWWMRYRDKDGV